MRYPSRPLASLLAAGLILLIAPRATAQAGKEGPARSEAQKTLTEEEKELLAVYDQYRDLMEKKDIEGIGKLYVQGDDLVVFDVIPPMRIVGWGEYRKNWEEFLTKIIPTITRVTWEHHTINAAPKHAWAHGIGRIEGLRPDGTPVPEDQQRFRFTHIWRKEGGSWRLVHEHVSVPLRLPAPAPTEQNP